MSASPPVLDTSTTDEYQYLYCYGSQRLTLQISNAAVYIGFGTVTAPGGAPIFPAVDEPFLPVIGSVIRPRFDAIRVKSYTLSTAARVIIRAI